MASAEIRNRALKLPLEEKLDLAQALWEKASPPPAFTLSHELKLFLEARREEALAQPEAGIPWEQVKSRLFDKA
jgi:putative addiction module component (TIGR02574 family)